MEAPQMIMITQWSRPSKSTVVSSSSKGGAWGTQPNKIYVTSSNQPPYESAQFLI